MSEKLLQERIKLIEAHFIGAPSYSTWYNVILGQTDNPYSYHRIGLFDPFIAREKKARQQLAREKGICIFCLKPREGDRRKRSCSPECEKNYRANFNEWIVSWGELRYRALERDQNKCRKCGSEANEVDHIIEIADGGNEWEIKNLQTLCEKCHDLKTAESAHKRAIRNRIFLLNPDDYLNIPENHQLTDFLEISS